MPDYRMPVVPESPEPAERTAYLVASGDSRLAANQLGWPTQVDLEAGIARAFDKVGWKVARAHQHDPAKGHGFIDSQRMGLAVFAGVPPRAPLIVAEAVWQYSHHILAGLRAHEGPILTVANFSGKWPGLVGLLGLNASLTKMGKPYSTTWSVDFTDPWFLEGIEAWTKDGRIVHDLSHVRPLPPLPPSAERGLGIALAAQLRREKALIGVFDEGCMGMYNAIFDDEYLNQLGIYKERLSQSALYAEMMKTPEAEAAAARRWLDDAGMTFKVGSDDATELTEGQLTQQLKMYLAAARLADDFGLDAIGIQYQQGLKDLVPASDLAEGLLNNADRPPVTSRDGTRLLREGLPIPHFNEVDEGCAVDALVTNRVWTAMNLDPATTLHDVRWGEQFGEQFVWVFEISGSVPASHLAGGYAGATSWRQNPMYFPAGGGTIKGVCKAGEVVWSRVYIEGGRLHADIGRARAVDLPAEETERRWQATNPEWPVMHAVLDGISRDQFMARHKANHVQVAYAPDAETADRALTVKAAMLDALGVAVHLCGAATITVGAQ
jgi:hypothetical protein